MLRSQITRSYVTVYLIKGLNTLFSALTIVLCYISIIGVKGPNLITSLPTLAILSPYLTMAITTAVRGTLLCLGECTPNDE